MAKTILIADDEPDQIATLEALLSQRGYKVIGASNGEQAFAKALDLEHPLKSLDAGIEDLVANVVALADLGRAEQFSVDTVRRVEPKVGRNDPCPCGSGKKFKQCHGK